MVLPAVYDNVDAGVEDQEKVGEVGQNDTPEYGINRIDKQNLKILINQKTDVSVKCLLLAKFYAVFKELFFFLNVY